MRIERGAVVEDERARGRCRDVAAEIDRDRAVGARAAGRGHLARQAVVGVGAREAILIDGDVSDLADLRRRIGDERDRRSGDVGIAVAVGDPVLEADVAGFLRAGRVGEGAVSVVDERAGAGERARDELDRRGLDAVGTLHIVGEDIDRDRHILDRLHHAVVDRVGNIIGDTDIDRRAGGRSVDVGDGDADAVGAAVLAKRRMICTVVVQRIAVGKRPADHRSVGAGHRGEVGNLELAICGRDRLRREVAIGNDERQRGAQRHAVEAVEHHGAHAIGGRYREAVAIGQAVGGRIRARRFARTRGQIVFIDEQFGAFGIQAGDRDAVIGTVDRDRQRRRRRIAVAVGDRVGENFSQRLADRKALHRLRLVVQDIAIAAIGIKRQRAISAGERRPDGAGGLAEADAGDVRAIGAAHIRRAVGCVGVVAARPRQYIAIGGRGAFARAAVFADAVHVGIGGRDIVDDAHVEAGIRARPVAVGHDNRKAVADEIFADARVRQRVVRKDVIIGEGAADHRSVGAQNGRETGDVYDPERTRRCARGENAIGHDLRAADRHIAEPVGGRYGEAARLGQRRRVGRRTIGEIVLVDDNLTALGIKTIDRHAIVGAVDRDRQRSGRGVAITVGDRVGEDLGQRFAGRKSLHRLRLVVQDIAIAAIGIERQRTISGRERLAQRAARHRRDRRAIGALSVGDAVGRVGVTATQARQNISVGGRGAFPGSAVLGHTVDIVARRRDIVDDAHVEAVGRGRPVAVGHDDREVVEDIVLALGAMRQRVVGQHIIIGEGAADHRSVGAQNGRETGDVYDPERTRRCARGENAIGHDLRAADRHIAEPVGGRYGEAARLGQRRRVGRRAIGEVVLVDDDFTAPDTQTIDRDTVVGAVDRDRQRRRRRVAVAVGDRVGEDLGQRLPGRKALHRLRRVVQHIGIAAVRVERQRAIGAGKRLAHSAARNPGDGRTVSAPHVGDAIGCVRIGAADAGQDIAVRGRRAFANAAVFGHAVDIGARRRRVVDDVDQQVTAGAATIEVGDDQAEIERFVGIGKRIVEQRIAEPDRALPGCRVIAVARHDESARRVAEHRLRQVSGRDDGSRERDAGHAVEREEGHRARCGLAGRGAVRSGRFAFACGQARLENGRHHGFGRLGSRAVADRDRQRRGRRIAVAVGDAIGEDVVDAARRARIPDIAVAAVGVDRQRAILALHGARRRKTFAARAANAGQGCAIGALRVCAGSAAGRARAGQDVARFGAASSARELVGVVARGRHIVDDRNRQASGRRIAIAVGDNDVEYIGRIVVRVRVVGQRIAVPDIARRQAGDRQLAERRRDHLTDRRDHGAVDRDRGQAVGGVIDDRTRNGFAVRGAVAARGLVAARRQSGFIDAGGRVERPGRLVGRDDRNRRLFVHNVRQQLTFFGLRKGQFGIGEQVTQRVGILDRPFGIGKIAARTAGAGLGIQIIEIFEKLRHGAGGNRVAVEHDRGNVDRAARNDEHLPVRQRDDEVRTRNGDIVDRCTSRQNDTPARVGNEDRLDHQRYGRYRRRHLRRRGEKFAAPNCLVRLVGRRAIALRTRHATPGRIVKSIHVSFPRIRRTLRRKRHSKSSKFLVRPISPTTRTPLPL